MPPRHLVKNYLVALVAAMCMIQYGYDATLFSSVQIAVVVSYFNNPSPPLVGAVTTAYNVSAVVFGFLVSPAVCDGFRRKWAIGETHWVLRLIPGCSSEWCRGLFPDATTCRYRLGPSIPFLPY